MSKGAKKLKTNAARKLDELEIAYELMQFEADEEDLSAERAAHDLGLPPEQVYKTLVVRGDKTGVMEACLPAGKELDFKALAALSGNKNTALVALKEVQPLTGYIRGGCSPIGGKKEYPVFVHEAALEHDCIGINAGARGLLFLLSPHDLLRATKGTPGNIAR